MNDTPEAPPPPPSSRSPAHPPAPRSECTQAPAGRPRKIPAEHPASPTLPKRPRGQPRKHPLPDPSVPKRPRSRPRKDPAANAKPYDHAPDPSGSVARAPSRPAGSKKPKPPAGRGRLTASRAVPPRVTLARIYKMDAYFRDLFHDRNPARRYPNYMELGKL